MAIRTIVKVGDDILNKKCRPVTDFNDRLFTLLEDMHDTLTEAHGAGLAAPQVGILRRLALVMVEDESFLEIINPEIIAREGEQDGALLRLGLMELIAVISSSDKLAPVTLKLKLVALLAFNNVESPPN